MILFTISNKLDLSHQYLWMGKLNYLLNNQHLSPAHKAAKVIFFKAKRGIEKKKKTEDILMARVFKVHFKSHRLLFKMESPSLNKGEVMRKHSAHHWCTKPAPCICPAAPPHASLGYCQVSAVIGTGLSPSLPGCCSEPSFTSHTQPAVFI